MLDWTLAISIRAINNSLSPSEWQFTQQKIKYIIIIIIIIITIIAIDIIIIIIINVLISFI